jgi:hypothetical protein
MVIPVVDTEEPPEPCQWADTLQRKNASSVSRQAGQNKCGEVVDEPKQNYNDGIVGDWSKLLRLEPAVVAF